MNLNPIANKTSYVDVAGDNSSRWEYVIDCVTYPVYIKPLYFFHDEEDIGSDDPVAGNECRAAGATNTGRDSEFYGIVVDRNRDGYLSTISTVTGLYDTIAASEVYQTLKNDLEVAGIANTPETIYVSGNGGKHQLNIKLDGLEWVNSDEKVIMHLVVITSVDSSTKHTIRLAAVNQNGIEIVGVGSATFNLSARHTKTIRERHAAFGVVIDNLISQWNDTIVPTMMLMNDFTFDKTLAIEIMSELMNETSLPETHQKKALMYYESIHMGNAKNSLLGVCSSLSEYLSDELASKPERLNEFKERLAKKSEKLIKKYLAKS